MWSLCAQYLWAVLWFSVHCQDSINVSVAMNFLFWWNMRLQRPAREDRFEDVRSKAQKLPQLLATVRLTSLQTSKKSWVVIWWTIEHDMWIWFKQPVHASIVNPDIVDHLQTKYIVSSVDCSSKFDKCIELWRFIAQDKFPPLIQIADCSKTTVVDFADRSRRLSSRSRHRCFA